MTEDEAEFRKRILELTRKMIEYEGHLGKQIGKLWRYLALAFLMIAGLWLVNALGCCRPEPVPDPSTVRGVALAVGLNRVDPEHYGGWDGALTAPENDARTMAAIAASRGFETELVLGPEATRNRLLSRLATLAGELAAPEILVVSYAGHGGQVPDPSGEEADGLDETWCLHDGQVVDDELAAAWAAFRAGVRILIVLDSCYSGGGARAADWEDEDRFRKLEARWNAKRPDRGPPPGILRQTYRRNRRFYDEIRRDESSIAARVLLLAASAEDEFSWSGPREGLFTGELRRVWDGGRFRGDLRDFHEEIRHRVEAEEEQTPVLTAVAGEPFWGEKPWTR